MKIPSAISLYFKCLTPFLIEKLALPIRRASLKKDLALYGSCWLKDSSTTILLFSSTQSSSSQ